jgi:hypothetical protein
MSIKNLTQYETYCSFCKNNRSIIGARYVRLANGRAIIKGKCSGCGLELLKANIMPKSSALKSLIKKNRRRGKEIWPIPQEKIKR